MRPQRILIADDDDKILALLASSLKKAGYLTFQATNGIIALEQARKNHPDLILADIAMPKMNGFELCKLIREDPITADIPFIFLTAKGEVNDRVTGLNLGADDYISKPFHISEVIARISTLLQRTALLSQETRDEGESDLQGDLEQLPLADVLQTLGMTQKSGGLKVTSGSRSGKMYFENGNIIQAFLSKYKSEEAVYRIISWEEGYFEFDSSDRVDRTLISATTNSLLMEGFNQREEYVKYKKAMPFFDSLLHIVNMEKAEAIKPASQKVLDLVDDQRTIQALIDMSPLNYLLTVKILYTLLKKGVLEAGERLQEDEAQEKDFSQLAKELYD